MKNLEVQNYGVAQMTTREMRTTNGGGWFWVIVAASFLIGLVSGLVDRDDSCKKQQQ